MNNSQSGQSFQLRRQQLQKFYTTQAQRGLSGMKQAKLEEAQRITHVGYGNGTSYGSSELVG